MADVQLENGFLRLANESVEALARTRIPGQAMQILWVILRETYGWNKKEALIRNKDFVEMTGIDRRKVSSLISTLTTMNIISVTNKGDKIAATYCFNKNYEEWILSPKKVTCHPKWGQRVTQKGDKKRGFVTNKGDNRLLQPSDTNASSDPKDSIKDIIKDIYIYRPNFDSIWKRYPSKVGKDKAQKKFKATVKTKEDEKNIHLALDNYLRSQRVKNGYVQNGSTWFNQWQDWIVNPEPPKSNGELVPETKKWETLS